MPLRIWLRLAETFVPAVIAVTIILAWQADRRDRAQLAAQLAAAQQTIADAASRQKDRDSQLTQTLAQLAAQKQSIVTPDQILKALPQTLSLPVPLTLQNANANPNVAKPNVGAGFSPSPTNPANVGARFSASPSDETTAQPFPSGQSANLPNNPTPKPGSPPQDAVIPAADLKPLYDFALDCKACQAKLSAAQNDLSDEKIKSASLTKERDAAIRAAKGGSALRRMARAAKWFLIGAAAGAIASKATH